MKNSMKDKRVRVLLAMMVILIALSLANRSKNIKAGEGLTPAPVTRQGTPERQPD